MNDYRPETFWEFVRSQPPIWSLKAVWAGGAVIIAGLLICYGLRDSLGYLAFIAVAFPMQALFAYSVQYRLYALGRSAYLDLCHKDPHLLHDVKLIIKGFDLWSQQPKSLNIDRPIYQFDHADVILADSSLILLGKLRQGRSLTFAAPAEVITASRETRISAARLLDWGEANGRIIIKIKGDAYSKPFKIEFKDHVEELRSWLNLAHLQGAVSTPSPIPHPTTSPLHKGL